MKNKNMNMLIKASLKSDKLRSAMYCSFVIISTILILTSMSIINPLWNSINVKLNNHILNKEIVATFSSDYSKKDIEANIKKIKKEKYVKSVYRSPGKLSVFEQTGILFNQYNLSYIHKFFSPKIVDGRCFSEKETEVIIIPKKIEDFNKSESKINIIDGGKLVGKTLEFIDESGFVHKLKVVGTYDTTDPICNNNELLIPRMDLLKYNNIILNNPQNSMPSISEDKSYIVVIDSPDNINCALEDLEEITTVYKQKFAIDKDAYIMALNIIMVSITVFILLTILGYYLFLKSNINNRTKELALYRTMGYKFINIYYIIVLEHFILCLLSLLSGTAIAYMLNYFIINPYLYKLVGNTFMEISAIITGEEIISTILVYIVILLLVCIKVVKRTEKNDLTILLKEH